MLLAAGCSIALLLLLLLLLKGPTNSSRPRGNVTSALMAHLSVAPCIRCCRCCQHLPNILLHVLLPSKLLLLLMVLLLL
jgi:hypothetical protein